MIELDIINYLNNDAILSGLLSTTGSDTKIYPLQVPLGANTPFIIYNLISDGGLKENIRESSLSFNCVSENYNTAEDIRNRIAKILDRQDEISRLIDSNTFRYLWSKKVGGAEFKDSDIDVFNRASIYDFEYVRREFLLTEDDEYILTEDGERIILQ